MAITFRGRIVNQNQQHFALAVSFGDGGQSYPVPLKVGDRIRIFTSAAEGHVLTTYTPPSAQNFPAMFQAYCRERLAVTLTRQGQKIADGILSQRADGYAVEPFAENAAPLAIVPHDTVTVYRFVLAGQVALDDVLVADNPAQRHNLSMATQGGYPVEITRHRAPILR